MRGFDGWGLDGDGPGDDRCGGVWDEVKKVEGEGLKDP